MAIRELDDKYLSEIGGGDTPAQIQAAQNAFNNYNVSNPTSGVINFSHPGTIYSDGSTDSKANLAADPSVVIDTSWIGDHPFRYNATTTGGAQIAYGFTPWGAEFETALLYDDPGSEQLLSAPDIVEWLDDYSNDIPVTESEYPNGSGQGTGEGKG